MNWSTYHTQSQEYASRAEIAYSKNRIEYAKQLYRSAAESESKALSLLDLSKKRTVGITVISLSSLWFRAGDYLESETVIRHWLLSDKLPEFAHIHLQQMLLTINSITT